MSITILLADDHTLVREGLRSMLEKDSTCKILGEADNGIAAVDLATRLCPDIVIMDIGMPGLNGIDATESLLKTCPKVNVIILSMHKEERFISGSFLAGAKGYLLKESLFNELMQAVSAVHKGQYYLSPQIAHVAVNSFINTQPNENVTRPASTLTSREREILQLLVEGKKVREIGSILCISHKTVETHKRNISEKLQIKQSVDLIKYALREGIVSFDTWVSEED